MSKRRPSKKEQQEQRQRRITYLGLINAAATGVAAAPLMGFPWWVGPLALLIVGISTGMRKVLMEEAELDALYAPPPKPQVPAPENAVIEQEAAV